MIEGQWAMIFVHIMTSIFGEELWHQKVFGDIKIVHILFILTITALMSSIVSNILIITGADTPMDAYIRIPRKSDKTKWNPLTSLLIITVLAIHGFFGGIFQTNSILFIFSYGLAFAKLSFKLQVNF